MAVWDFFLSSLYRSTTAFNFDWACSNSAESSLTTGCFLRDAISALASSNEALAFFFIAL